MAKDPALLWYFNDWMGGTATLSRHLKGCYIDLLCVQFNSGPLSLDEIKTVLGSDFGLSWPTLQKKFEKTDNGLYYNQRLQSEKDKRINFTSSRRKNAMHMHEHMENINENINNTKNIYGEFQKVTLTTQEYEKLVERMGERNTIILISELDNGIASKGYKYKSHYATILNWARRKSLDYKEKVEKKTKTFIT